MLLTENLMDRSKRLQVLKLAHFHLTAMIDILIGYELYSLEEVRFYSGELNDREFKRQLLIQETKAK